MNRKFAAILLVLALVLSLVPVGASAAGEGLEYEFDIAGGEMYAIVAGFTGTATELTIPAEVNGHPVRAIGEKAFLRCTKLVEIHLPEGITAIGESAFLECTALTQVELPDSLTELGRFAFYGCSALKEVTIPAGISVISCGAFHSCSGLTTMTLPESVAVIDSHAFRDCTGLKEITIPEGVWCIGHQAFYGCKNLTGITIPGGVDTIYSRAFEGCTSLAQVTIREGVTTIDDYAFRKCKKLQAVTIPATVTDIGDWAFSGCTGLSEITFCADAPEFGYQVFDQVTAVARYPQNNGSWTEDVIQDYSGDLTWQPYAPVTFCDVNAGDYYYDSVAWALTNGITAGVSETAFGPDGVCNRAHVVTFLWRSAGCPEPTSAENPFVDVKEGDFFHKAVLWAVENGITNGVDATHFGPTVPCNRAQVVTFLYRAMQSPAVGTAACPFTDVVRGEWYEPAVLWAVENGITNGLSADTFGVDTTCNRAQVVTFLYRTYVN